MLTINLLPASARKTALSSLEQFHRTPLMWMAVVVMVGLVMALWVPLTIRRGQLRQLNAKIDALTPKKLEVERLQQFTRQLHAQEASFKGLAQGRYRWSRRLNTLSTLTPEGTWFTELSLDQTKGLVIQGSAIGEGGNEMVHIGRLVQDLKADSDFSAAVRDIQIESIKRFQDKEIEIVQFTLTCALADAPGS